MQNLKATSLMLANEQKDALDDLAFRFRVSTGTRLTRGAIIRVAIDNLLRLEEAHKLATIKVLSRRDFRNEKN